MSKVSKVDGLEYFDRDFYIKAYIDIPPRVDPHNHYTSTGRRLGRLPNMTKFMSLYPSFDINVYRSSNDDLIKLSNERLMSHFHHFGKNEGRPYQRMTSTHGESKHVKKKPIGNTLYINTVNYDKIKMDNYINYIPIPNTLQTIIDQRQKDTSKPIYLILSEWGGYPAFGGGECWLNDTAKWMSSQGFSCYYIYTSDPTTNKSFDSYDVQVTEFCTYIKCSKYLPVLIAFIKLLDPKIISHQGINRSLYLKIANLLGKPFITGFCFWQDIIDASKHAGAYNQHMLDRELYPDKKFTQIISRSTGYYVAGQFMNDVVRKLHHVECPVINTVSDDSQYKITKFENDVYVTVINICGLKGGNILESIIKQTNLDIPFLLVDSQEVDSEINNKLKRQLIERNQVEQSHKSVYIRGPITDIKRIYSQTRVLLIPTLVDETFCRVAFEGMMNHIPILSTNNGNLRYIINGYADYLCESATSWSDKINSIYHDQSYLQTMKSRFPTINPSVDIQHFYDLVNQCTIHSIPHHNNSKNIGILCPWGDQGLGIQCREYCNILNHAGYNVSIFSFKPYHATNDNPRLQTDENEWKYSQVHYDKNVRERIDASDFIEYLYEYQVGNMIIVETCHSKIFELAQICKMLSIPVVAIPNLETIRYSEIVSHNVFNKIICNNQMTYNLISKYYPNKSTMMGFRILNKNFNSQKTFGQNYTFFCSGGLNSLSRKNIDKVLVAFKELDNMGKLGQFKLHVYIQGAEIPPHIEQYKSSNILFDVGAQSYNNISKLYKTNDIFIHMGDHEGLGLGFYESIVCGTPVMTIDTPPNNEIIRENINGWLVECGYTQLNDNDEGIVYRANITPNNIKNKLLEIISTYNRDKMYKSTINDYINRYPISEYYDQINKIFSYV